MLHCREQQNLSRVWPAYIVYLSYMIHARTRTYTHTRGPSRPDLMYEIPNLLGFVVDSWIHSGFRQIPNDFMQHVMRVFYVDSWIDSEWIQSCSVQDSSRDGLLAHAHTHTHTHTHTHMYTPH